MTDQEMQAQATQRLRVALPAEKPAGIRKREIFWIALTLALAGAWAEGSSPIDLKVAEEAREKAAERHAQIYAALADCMNGRAVIKVADEPVAECRRLKK